MLLSGYFLISSMASAIYAAHGRTVTARFSAVSTAGLLVFLWFWFTQQLEPYTTKWPLDMGAFVAVLWFLLVPYYFWRYERWRGLLKLVTLAAIYFASWVVGVGLWWVAR